MKFLTTPLDQLDHIRHGFFTRQGGVSKGIYASLNSGLGSHDDAANIQDNRRLIADSLGIPAGNLITVHQIHSAIAVPVTDVWPHNPPKGDAMVTDRPDIGLGILTADCAPVLFAARNKPVIGAAHAGWRGAIGGILESTVTAMEELGAQREDISAAIGPCIGPQSYEVSESFRTNFLDTDAAFQKFFRNGTRENHYIFDLPGFVAAQLKKIGIGAIHDTQQDTLGNEDDFFSYRRTTLRGEKDYGRQLSVIALKKENV